MKTKILLSTYNGQKYIEEQLYSISRLILQSDHQIELIVRDDGSTDNTLEVLNKFASDEIVSMVVYPGNNCGVIESFWWLIENCGDADYYALCDQDDSWDEFKLYVATHRLECCDNNEPSLYCSAYDFTNQNLEPIARFTSKSDFSLESILTQNTSPGCTYVFNHSLMNKLRKIETTNLSKSVIMHDSLVLMTCATFGKVIYDKNSYLLYRQHSNNAVGHSSTKISRLQKRIRNISNTICNKNVNDQVDFFVNVFGSEIPACKMEIFDSYRASGKNVLSRIKFISSNRFTRSNLIDHIFYSIFVLLGFHKPHKSC